MSYGVSSGYARGLGYGGGAKVLYFSPAQVSGMKLTTMYQYMNVGVAPASQDETDDAAQYQYMNVGVAPAPMNETDDAIQYQYKNVQARPAGSGEDITPTMN